MNSRSFHGMMVPIIESAHSLLSQFRASLSGFTIFYCIKNLLYQLYYTTYTINILKFYYFVILLKYYFLTFLYYLFPTSSQNHQKPHPADQNHQPKKKNHIQWVATNPSNLQPNPAKKSLCHQPQQPATSHCQPPSPVAKKPTKPQPP